MVAREAARSRMTGITIKSELVYAADCPVSGIRDAWVFDDLFSAFVTPGIGRKNLGLVGVFVRVRSPESFQSGE